MKNMKRIFNSVFLILSVLVMLNCTDDKSPFAGSDEFRVIANLENSSRTKHELENNSVKVSWCKDDAIGLFTSNDTTLLEYRAEYDGSQTSLIPINSMIFPNEDGEIFAFYPYSEHNNSNIIFPDMSSQNYVTEETLSYIDFVYAKGKISSYQLSLNFKHLFSFIKLNIKSELLRDSEGIFIRSDEPIICGSLSCNSSFFNNSNENSTPILYEYLWYSIPSDILEKQETITCYIAVIPTSELNYLTFYRFEDGWIGDGLFERKAPEGGFQAGKIYELNISSDEIDLEKVYNEEREALLEFYNATGGDNWKNNSNWCSDKPLNEWYGVNTVDGYVESLMLTDNNLTGNIPEEIGKLSHLKYLDLGWNKLSGVLPESVTDLYRLKSLNLIANKLQGALPDNMVTLIDKLEVLNLSFNKFSGRLPESIINHPNWKNLWVGIISGGFDVSGIKLPAADFTVQCLDGKILNSDVEFSQNTLTAILHWSPTCYFSDQYIVEQLLPVYKMYKDRGFEIIGYCLDEKSLMLDYINEKQIPWKNIEYTYNNKVNGFFTNLTPTIFIVDQNKEVIFQSLTQDRNEILNVLYEQLGKHELYTSTDYSRDGEVQLIQRASVGKGINLVFMGEGFVDRDMGDNGLYEKVMKNAVEQYFAYEPLKSFRNRFNVYSVKVVSPNAEFYPNAKHRINEDNSVCFQYACKIPELENSPYQMISVIYNSGCNGRSYTSMYSGDRSYVGYMMDGVSNVLNHEVCGHGLGRLMDEYVENGFQNQTLPYESKVKMDYDWNTYGWGANVDWRNNPRDVKWSHFLDDMRYSGELLGIYEGSYLYGLGAYRPTENSMMRYNDSPFNAPSREKIYQVIMELSEGEGWEYNYEDFVSYDEINRNYETSRALSSTPSKSYRSRWEEYHKVPIIINGTWKDDKY